MGEARILMRSDAGVASDPAAVERKLSLPELLWNDGFGTSAFLRFLDGDTGRLSSSFPSLNSPVSGLTMIIVAAASAAWLLLTAWLSRRERDLHLRRPA